MLCSKFKGDCPRYFYGGNQGDSLGGRFGENLGRNLGGNLGGKLWSNLGGEHLIRMTKLMRLR